MDSGSAMPQARVDKLIWVLLFGGLVVIGLAFSVARSDATLGWLLGAFGAADIVIGIVLIWLRSRTRRSSREK